MSLRQDLPRPRKSDHCLVRGLLGTGPPGTRPPLLTGRFGIKIGSNQDIDVESMLNDARGEGDADSRVGSGGLCLTNPSQPWFETMV